MKKSFFVVFTLLSLLLQAEGPTGAIPIRWTKGGAPERPWCIQVGKLGIAPSGKTGFLFRQTASGKLHTLFSFSTKNFTVQTPYKLLITYQDATEQFIYLSVKLYRDDKEIKRFNSRMNPPPQGELVLPFNSGEADLLEIGIRSNNSQDNIGSSAKIDSVRLQLAK